MTSHSFGIVVRPVHPDVARFAILPWPLARVVAAIVRRHRNAAAADWLSELPPYLLADIGIDRVGIEEIRAHGVPTEGRSVHGRRPLHCTTSVDIASARP